MFLHFHKLTTELFNSIKTQQINVFNASVDSNANCLCHIPGAIKSDGLQRAVLFYSGSLDWNNTWGCSEDSGLPHSSHFFILVCQNESPSAEGFHFENRKLQLIEEKLLTDFCGGHSNVVPHVGLSVQWFGQRDLPIIDIDIELPLKICVPINEVPTKKKKKNQIFNRKPCGDQIMPHPTGNHTNEAFYMLPWALWLMGPYPSRGTCRLMHIKNSRKSVIIIWGIITAFTSAAGGIKAW